MLAELRIENFAIIDHLELQFGSGLVIFTGETGAGKSILIDAVETLLGSRADATMIRSQSERASIEGLFKIPATVRSAVHAILEREDLLDEPDYLTLGREIRSNGRNIARINGRSVNAALLREVGEFLVDVHGQSEHLSLLRVSQHLPLLDNYAGVEELHQGYRSTHSQLQAVRGELEELRQSERNAARRIDTLSYQINEIDTARLQPGEDEQLRDERNRLANAETLATHTQEALLSLDEGASDTPAVTDLYGRVIHAIAGLARLDPSLSSLNQQAQLLFENLADMSRELRDYQEAIEFNPKRLDQVEERLGLIHNLKRKYGESIPTILEFAENARRQLDTITHVGERIQELEAQEHRLLELLGRQGYALSETRRQRAAQLERAIEAELLNLQMPSARFMVEFQHRPDPQGAILEDGRRLAFDASGLDQVEFMIAPNPGEGFKPLAKIASGGETSRLMLALKNILASADQVPTLIFDEIDQGIGGRVGAIVGQKLWSLARHHQVLCVTHLPQLAAYGELHFSVTKQLTGGRTITEVTSLDGESRLLEIAQMIGGVSEGTLHSARELLQTVEKRVPPKQVS